ncbi:alpha/beta-hydrolase [Cylindrobasidium torrendii FP15055 ss-10]|uniref:Alpha/beta-hydrolase n=1 Tax=Cylindrobasidium torrendii FP15055 ss-10 TaxID=1314674 RepID=A0A0D7BLP9_9AGAR|nr:alpha/beta-hydrolase [Cylindrobasidium torrendii FP15055 ss-10]
MLAQALLVVCALVSAGTASPLVARQSGVTVLSDAQVDVYTPYTYYASAAYCPGNQTINWSCGANCQANPKFVPIASGGDGDGVQFWYVGYDPSLKSIIVGHQGTDTSKLLPVLTDANFFLTDLEDGLFPGLDSDVQVHNGFGESQADSARDVLAAVKKGLSAYSTKAVTVVGHSLGGAIALISGVFLDIQIPAATVKVVTYGQPRVGNSAFADWVDAHLDSVVHITNKKDLVPILPGRFLGFAHASGETHIREDDSKWVSCPGQDSTADGCTIKDVPNILVGDANDHGGPYDGIRIGCKAT